MSVWAFGLYVTSQATDITVFDNFPGHSVGEGLTEVREHDLQILLRHSPISILIDHIESLLKLFNLLGRKHRISPSRGFAGVILLLDTCGQTTPESE